MIAIHREPMSFSLPLSFTAFNGYSSRWIWSALVFPCFYDPGVVYRCGVGWLYEIYSCKGPFSTWHHLRYANVWITFCHTVLSFQTFCFSHQPAFSFERSSLVTSALYTQIFWPTRTSFDVWYSQRIRHESLLFP